MSPSGSSNRGDEGDDRIGPEERYCTSCGEVIHEQAEICPECGVRQKGKTDDSGTDVAKLLVLLIVGVPIGIAVIVIFSAVVGTFVLGLGAETTENVQAGVNVQYDPSSDSVTATYVSEQNADSVIVRFETSYGTAEAEMARVGDQVRLGPSGVTVEGSASVTQSLPGGITDGDEVFVTVTAKNNDGSTIVLTKENTV